MVEIQQIKEYLLDLLLQEQLDLDGLVVVRTTSDHSSLRDWVFGGAITESEAVVIGIVVGSADVEFTCFD